MFPFNGGHFGGGGHGFGGGLFALAGIALVVAIILVLAAGRREDDRAGTRSQTRYLGAITLLSLFIALFAFFGVARALTDLIVEKGDHHGHEHGGFDPRDLKHIFDQLPAAGQGGPGGVGIDINFEPEHGIGQSDDADYRAAMRSGLLGLAAAGIFLFHLRRARRVVPSDRFPGDATGRVARAALYGACAVAAIIALFAAARGIYGIFRIIAPGVAGSSDAEIGRQEGIAQFVSFGLLAGAAVLIFLRAWYWMPEHRE